jgi:hypothetical protein
MPFVILILGIILVVVAYQGTHAALLADLQQDLPGFFKWALAISAVVALGYVPGLQKPSRYLLGLVMLVIFLMNYSNILNGFKSLSSSGQASTDLGSTSSLASNPTASYSTAYAPQAASAAGETTSTGSAIANTAAGVSSGTAPLSRIPPTDPNFYLAQFHSPSVGFGGQVV